MYASMKNKYRTLRASWARALIRFGDKALDTKPRITRFGEDGKGGVPQFFQERSNVPRNFGIARTSRWWFLSRSFAEEGEQKKRSVVSFEVRRLWWRVISRRPKTFGVRRITMSSLAVSLTVPREWGQHRRAPLDKSELPLCVHRIIGSGGKRWVRSNSATWSINRDRPANICASR